MSRAGNASVTDCYRSTLLGLALDNPGIRGRYKVSAGLIYKRQLIATGINKRKTHPIMLNKGYREGQIYLHAEADCIKNALRILTVDQLKEATLFVARVKKNSKGQYVEALAKPCDGCMNLINMFEIKEVEWTVG